MLNELLDVLGHMPFAIRLVAQLRKSSNSMPKMLFEAWQGAGPEILNSSGESISRSIELITKVKL